MIEPTPCRPFTYLEANAAQYPDVPAVVQGEETLTFTELLHAVQAFMAFLFDEGLRQGDVAAVALPNTWEYVVLEIAIPALGAVLLPLPLSLGTYEAESALRRSGAKLIIADDDPGSAVREAAARSRWGRVLSQRLMLRGAFQADRGDIALHPTAPAEIAQIALTSGTTGLPKLASLSAELKQLTFEGFVARLGIRPGDRMLPLSPITQGVGEMCLYALRRGATLVMTGEGRFAPEHSLALAEQTHATHLGAVPTMIRRMLHSPALEKADLQAARVTAVAGAPLAADLARSWEQRTGSSICCFFGAMDVGQLAVTSPDDPAEKRWHTVGRPHERAEWMVCNEQGAPVDPGQEGEICMRGPLVQQRYWGQDDGPYADDGWAHFGDLGFIDEDGYLHVVGRSKDIIIRGGSNINPYEVEAILLEHPEIDEVCVVGRADPDLGERAVAFVVTRSEAQMALTDLTAFLGERGLARHKWPEHVVTIDQLPIGGTGKINRRELRRRAETLRGYDVTAGSA